MIFFKQTLKKSFFSFVFIFLTILFFNSSFKSSNCLAAGPVEKLTPFQKGQAAYERKDFRQSAYQFYLASRKSNEETIRAKFFLGISLYKLELYQVAAFPLMVVALKGPDKLKKIAINHLVALSNKLDESSILSFSLKKLTPEELTDIGKETFLYRLGEAYLNEKNLDKAEEALKASLSFRENDPALYLLALTYMRNNRPDLAYRTFERLYFRYESNKITDKKRGQIILGMARSSYQMKDYKKAIELYRSIPKDHPYYRDSLVELTWSLFRQGQLRSALSIVQTLHTPFYENFYDPESLLVRSIILLFVCQNDEAEKAWVSFETIYRPSYEIINHWLEDNVKLSQMAKEIAIANASLQAFKKDKYKDKAYKGSLPFFLSRTLLEEPSIKRKFQYIEKLKKEKLLLAKTFGEASELNRLGQKILESRERVALATQADLFRNLVEEKAEELADLINQMDFIRYEILNGKRVKYKIDQAEKKEAGLAETTKRKLLIENGYRYWPFEGEYWLDELGNFQYMGVNRCE